MKSGNLLADANAIVHYLNDDKLVCEIMDTYPVLFVPVIAWGELFYGAQNSRRATDNIAKLENFIRRTTILGCDRDTGVIYSNIRTQLKKIGRPIPDNDIWISAIALQYNLPVITRDKHFDVVPDLQLVTW